MPKLPFRVSPMLATSAEKPFNRPGWVFEEKYDGVRILAYKEAGKVSLISRNNIDRSERFALVAAEIAKLASQTLVLDGEIVVFDSKHISRFQLLQRRSRHQQYAIFDCLYADGHDLRGEPLSARRKAQERLLDPSPVLLIAKRIGTNGVKAFEIAARRGLEGLLAKNAASAYRGGRSSDWVKIRSRLEEEFVIGGFTEPEGSREHFGALLLGVYSGGKMVYAGKVGSGFDEPILRSLRQKLEPMIRQNSPFSTEVVEAGATFVQPKLVAQISYTERTRDGKLRHPVFLGLRDDKNPTDVRPRA